ncbi:MAG: hypothetical protein HY326_09445 [Chloroflexi bacterium]|nr:hypothetical protein [Chloroflexota bacterium]
MRWVNLASVFLLGVFFFLGCSAQPQASAPGTSSPQPAPQATSVAPPATAAALPSPSLAPTGGITATAPWTQVLMSLPVFGGSGNLPPGWQSVNVEEVEWRDSSLGCPEPGKMYLQVITPGYRVVLQKDGETIEVHTDKSGERIVICNMPTPNAGSQLPHPAATPETQAPQAVVEAAKRALAKDQGLAAEGIQVASVEKQTWSDASLGCPKAGYAYAQVLTPGYKVILKSGNKEYVYHTDEAGKQTVTCLPPSGALPAGKTVVVPDNTDKATAARQELSSRLKIGPESIQVLSVTQSEMPLQNLGCGSESTVTVPAQIIGTVIILQAGGKQYEYRAHLNQLVFCGEKTN